MASRISGRAKTVAEEICHLTHGRQPEYPSARKQRQRLGKLITHLAEFPVEPHRLEGNVPDWVVRAVAGRRSEHAHAQAQAA